MEAQYSGAAYEMARRIQDSLATLDPDRAWLPAAYRWYSDARDFARTLQAGTRYSLEQVAGVIAALSPRTQWHTNKNWAIKAVDAHHTHKGHISGLPAVGTFTMRYKAWRILDGADVWDTLNGLKTRDFAATILGDDAPVIDSWAFFLATGRKLVNNGENTKKVSNKLYREIQDAYHIVGGWLGIPGYVVQAWGWIAQRGSAE
jgi:hypothetical protein